MLKILHLNLKQEYWLEIKDRTKPLEFRRANEYWKKRLLDRDYDEVHFKLGYPKADDKSRIIKRAYIGYIGINITHEHFGSEEIAVFAIRADGKDL